MAMAKLEAVNLMLDAIGEAPDSITQVGPTQVAFDTSFFNLKFHQVIFIKRKSSGAGAHRRPCFVCAAIERAFPSSVRGPVLLPPCSLQRFRPPMAGFWQSVPRRVLAKHLVPGQPGPKRVALPASISSAWLTLFTIYFRRSRGWAFNHRSGSPFEGANHVPQSAHPGPWTIAPAP